MGLGYEWKKTDLMKASKSGSVLAAEEVHHSCTSRRATIKTANVSLHLEVKRVRLHKYMLQLESLGSER